MTTHTVQQWALDKKRGLTLAELTRVVQDAHRANLHPDSTVKVKIGWSSQLHQVEVSGVES